jgi:hypothetical protein
MKTQIETPVMKVRISEVIMVLLMIGVVLTLSSCSKDDEVKPDTRPQFIGTYAVEDVSKGSGYIYEYDVTISNGTDGDLNLSNFADIFNVPVKATVDGNKITIKQQSFTNPKSGKTIKVWGDGTLTGDILNFTYTTEGFLDYSGTCTGTKKAQ